MALLNFRFEMFIGGVWVDVTSYVRDTSPVTAQRGTGDWSPKPQPATLKLVLDNTDDRWNSRNAAGPYYGKLLRNLPIRVYAVVDGVSYARFYGEIYGYTPSWNKTNTDRTMAIDAAGVLRRIYKNNPITQSVHRSWMMNHPGFTYPIVQYYYPLDEGPGADEALPVIGTGPARYVSYYGTQLPTAADTFGTAKMNDWYPNGALLPRLFGLKFPTDIRSYNATNGWEMSVLISLTTDDAQIAFEIDCVSYTLWVNCYITFGGTDGNIQVLGPTGTSDISPFTIKDFKNVGPVILNFSSGYSGGNTTGYVAWQAINDPSSAVNINVAYTYPSFGVAKPRTITAWNTVADPTTSAQVGISNLSVSGTRPGTLDIGNTMFYATRGANLEQCDARINRLCTDLGISTIGNFGPQLMGRQYLQSFADHLEEISSSCDGFIIEHLGSSALSINAATSRRLYDGIISNVDYTELVDDPEVSEDDQHSINQVTVTNIYGGSRILQRTDGPLSIANIGLFSEARDTNNFYFSEALSAGYLQLARGSIDEVRMATVTVSAQASPTRYTEWLSRKVDEGLRLTGFGPAGYVNDIIVRIVAIEDNWTQTDHYITFTVVPAITDYRVYQVNPGSGDLTYSALDGDGSTVTSLTVAGVTTLPVTNVSSSWTTTDVPFLIMAAGEVMNVTAVSAPVGLTQNMTVTRAVNGVVKDIPAGSPIDMYPGNYLAAF